MELCGYCASAPTIDNSHVVPDFMGRYIKQNGPFGNLLNLWNTKPRLDIHKGPYLCQKCDNEVFSAWETAFSNGAWRRPFDKLAWTTEPAVRFLVSLVFRYALHFIETSPIPGNRSYSEYVRNMSMAALRDPSRIGRSCHLYPFVHRPITSNCSLIPGINHFLSLAVHGQSLPKEGDLPNSFLVVVPKVCFLFCDGELSTCKDNTMLNPSGLTVGGKFDPATANTDMPQFLHTVLNRAVGQGQAHQKSLGRWKNMAYGVDKLANPRKACYTAAAQDRELLLWQRANCR